MLTGAVAVEADRGPLILPVRLLDRAAAAQRGTAAITRHSRHLAIELSELIIEAGVTRHEAHGRAGVTAAEMIPPGAVTTADLYRELLGIRTDVVRAMVRLESADEVHKDHEMRLRALEQFKWKLLGAVLAGSAAVSAATTWVGLALSQH